MDIQNIGSDGILNGGLSSAFSITLSAPITLKFVNFEPGAGFVLIIQQDSAGSKYAVTFPAGVTWQAGVAPNITTKANGVDIFKFVCTSSTNNTYKDVGGAPSKFPARIASAALGLVVGLGLGTQAVNTIHLSSGAGTAGEIGNLSPVQDVYAGTGAGLGSGTWLREDDGSGSVKIGKFGGFAVGTASRTGRLDSTSNSGYWLPNGKLVTRNTITSKSTVSGATLFGNGGSGSRVACWKANGALGYMTTTPTNGAGTCN